MAKQEAKPAAEAEQPAPPPKSKKLLILAIAAILVFGLVGGGTFMYYKAMKAQEAHDDEEATETTKKKQDKKEKLPSIFVNLEPFTVNLAQDPNQKALDQYLQVAVSVEFEDPQAEAMMKASMPKIRNSITLLLSGKMAGELLPREGKEKLAAELKNAINEVLEPGGPPKKGKKGEKAKSEQDGPAKAVLFTSFIIQ